MSMKQPVSTSVALNEPPHVLLLAQLSAWREERKKRQANRQTDVRESKNNTERRCSRCVRKLKEARP